MTIAFYNTENLFDTRNDDFTFDDDRTPEGKDAWTKEKYELKLNHIGQVVSEIGTELSGHSPEIIGLCEVENIRVLEDLLNTEKLQNKVKNNFQTVDNWIQEKQWINYFLPDKYKEYRSPINTCLKIEDLSKYKKIIELLL